MIIQYLIDWSSISIPSESDGDNQSMYYWSLWRNLMELSRIILQNGILVKTKRTESALSECINRLKKVTNIPVNLSGTLEYYHKLYTVKDNKSAVLYIDDTSDKTEIDLWEAYLRKFTLNFRRDGNGSFTNYPGGHNSKNARFLIKLGKDTKKEERCLFWEYPLKEFLKDVAKEDSIVLRWLRMQSFSSNPTLTDKFNEYLFSFSVASKGFIRIYDPYLETAFLPFEVKDQKIEEKDQKRVAEVKLRNRNAWRISLKYFCNVFAKNPHINCIELITKWDKAADEQLSIMDCIDTIFEPIMKSRKKSLTVILHFLEKSDGKIYTFHDRFIVNEHYAFAIGHGCDICGYDYKNKVEKNDNKFYMEKNLPDKPVLSEFNVFCAGAKTDLFIFGAKNSEEMYPKCEGIKVKLYGDMKSKFKLGSKNVWSCGENGFTRDFPEKAELKILFGIVKEKKKRSNEEKPSGEEEKPF